MHLHTAAFKTTTQGLKLNATTYKILLTACRGAKDWESSLKFLAEARHRGVPLDEELYALAMATCGTAGARDKVLDLYDEMLAEVCNVPVAFM